MASLVKAKLDRGVRASPYDPFGPVPLRRGERLQDFERLRDAIEAYWCPKDFRGYENVHEYAITVWKITGLRRGFAGVIDSHLSIVDVMTFIFPDNPAKAKNVALNYLSADPEKHKRAVALLAEHGFSERELEAHAMAYQGPTLKLIDQMIDRGEAARNRLAKQLGKHQKHAARAEAHGADKPGVRSVERKRFTVLAGQAPRERFSGK